MEALTFAKARTHSIKLATFMVLCHNKKLI